MCLTSVVIVPTPPRKYFAPYWSLPAVIWCNHFVVLLDVFCFLKIWQIHTCSGPSDSPRLRLMSNLHFTISHAAHGQNLFKALALRSIDASVVWFAKSKTVDILTQDPHFQQFTKMQEEIQGHGLKYILAYDKGSGNHIRQKSYQTMNFLRIQHPDTYQATYFPKTEDPEFIPSNMRCHHKWSINCTSHIHCSHRWSWNNTK